MEGVGAAIGKVADWADKIIARTKIGSAIGKVFTEAGSKIGAVRQGIQSFESKALGRFGEKVFGKSQSAVTQSFEKYSFGELRQKYRSQIEKGLSRAESREAIEAGQVCFVAGTQVHTKDGEKKIEDVKVGDEILSYNQANHTYEYKPVVRTFEKYAESILSVKIEDESETIGVTPEHPFYVRVRGARSNLEGSNGEGEWKSVKNLQVGDEVLEADGRWKRIEALTTREGGAKVYNFEVADNHNYFVGENGTLVHNTCNIPSVDDLSLAAQAQDKGGLTKAGRALQKHGDRQGSVFPQVKGGPKTLNPAGQEIVDDILTTPGATFNTRYHKFYGDIIEVTDPMGRGIRYNSSGGFMGLLDP